MKPRTKARKALEKHLIQDYPVFEAIYYDGPTSNSGYILSSNSVDKIYFKMTFNDDYSKVKVTFQFAPIDPLILEI